MQARATKQNSSSLVPLRGSFQNLRRSPPGRRFFTGVPPRAHVLNRPRPRGFNIFIQLRSTLWKSENWIKRVWEPCLWTLKDVQKCEESSGMVFNCVESNLRLLWFCFTILCSVSGSKKKNSWFSQPIRHKTGQKPTASVIGWDNYRGFSFTTLNGKALYVCHEVFVQQSCTSTAVLVNVGWMLNFQSTLEPPNFVPRTFSLF